MISTKTRILIRQLNKLVYTKVLINVEQQDIKDSIDVVKSWLNKDKPEHKEGRYWVNNILEEIKDSKSPNKQLTIHHTPSKSDPMLAITGNALHSYSPKAEKIAKGLFNMKLKNSINIENNLEVLENFALLVEEKYIKLKADDENKKKKIEEIKRSQDDQIQKQDRKFKAKRYTEIWHIFNFNCDSNFWKITFCDIEKLQLQYILEMKTT